jgi:hypothetical protein
MQETFFLVLKIKRSRWGTPRSIRANKISRRKPLVVDDCVVLRIQVEVPYDALREVDAQIEDVEAEILSCDVVNYGTGLQNAEPPDA